MGCVSSSEAQANEPLQNLPIVIFITGAPGSGKRTQCAKVVEKYHFESISVFQALKQEAEGDSEQAKSIKAKLDSGQLIESAVVVDVLDKVMAQKNAKVYLIEGFPKNKDNIDVWNKKMSSKYHLKHVFYFHCALDVLEQRVIERGKKSGRADDAKEVVRARLEKYKAQTRPVIDFYAKKNKIVHINSERRVDKVFQQICSYVD